MIEKNTSTMNIYEKLTNMQNDLLEVNIPKSGKNKFGGFNYYELDDLLPPILILCKQYGCTLFFNFPTDVDGNCNRGTLNLVNWSDKEDKILVEVPFPQLEKLPKMNYAQSSGTYQTYMKRYLILHTFDIVEDEIIDATEMSVEVDKQERAKSSKGGKANATKGKTAPKKKMNVQKKPKALQKVIDRFYEENGTDAECTPNKLNGLSMKMFREKEITKDERVEIYDYLKK